MTICHNTCRHLRLPGPQIPDNNRDYVLSEKSDRIQENQDFSIHCTAVKTAAHSSLSRETLSFMIRRKAGETEK